MNVHERPIVTEENKIAVRAVFEDRQVIAFARSRWRSA